MKPKVFTLEVQFVNNEEYIIDRLVNEFRKNKVPPHGEYVFVNDIYCLLLDNYLATYNWFPLKVIKRVSIVKVYKFPPDLPYHLDGVGTKIYEVDI